MKKTVLLIIALGLAAALSSCGATSPDTEPEAKPIGAGRMGMGMGSGMMARHHATIPEEYAGRINPVTADQESLERGAEIYAARCAACHGDGGMGDGPNGEGLDPAPVAIAHTSQMMGDDYQFWRISEGGAIAPFNSSMIAWKGVLDEQARWDVINYVQALGSGQVIPREYVGGAAFDPDAELAQRAEMLAEGVAQDLITQEEADTFDMVHAAMDGYIAEMGDHNMGGMDDMEAMMLSALIVEGKITQEQSDVFSDVHDRLLAAELME